MWSITALFSYVGNFAANYLIKPFFTYIHGSVKGLGTVKTPKDIKKLQDDEDHVLDRLIEQKLLARGGAGLTDEQKLHSSETSLTSDDADYIIRNGDIGDLKDDCNKFIKYIFGI